MIALGVDHAGYHLKTALIKYLAENGYEYKDYGCFSETSCDYPDFAEKVATDVAAGKCERGILICGTGVGISIAANKIRGIRAALCHDTFSAKAARLHNDANVLAMGERVIGEGLMREVVCAFLTTPFSGEQRHVRRIDKITKIENKR